MTRTLRIDADLDEALKKMAEESGESVNSIVGRGLRRQVEWDHLAERAGLVVVSSVTLGKLMDSQSMDEARALGESAGTEVFLPFVVSTYGEVTLASALEAIGLISRYMGRFESHYTTEGQRSVLTIRHARGSKWSAFYLGIAKTVFETLGLPFTTKVTEELVSLEFGSPETARRDA